MCHITCKSLAILISQATAFSHAKIVGLYRYTLSFVIDIIFMCLSRAAVSGQDLFSPPATNGNVGDTHGTTIRTSDVTSPQRPSESSDRGSSPHTERLFSSPPHAMATSELDMMSSPLQYGTPSSRIGTPGSRMGTPGR